MSRAVALARLALLLWLLAGCSALPAALGGPTPVPTAPIDPYDAAVATAEAAGDGAARAAAYYERGNVQLDLGAPEAAIADYDQAIALDPRNARAFHNRGLAHVARGDAEAALADYSAAIRLDPAYLRAYRNRLVLLEQRGDLAAAAADYARLAELDPENAADYRYREGSARYGLRDRGGARAAFDAALRANPQHVDALYERGLLLFAEGRPAEAIRDFDAALRLSPRAANAYYARGLAAGATGDHDRALSDFTRALELQPDNPPALIGRASAALALGRADDARADLAQLEGRDLDETLSRAVEALRQQLGGPAQAP